MIRLKRTGITSIGIDIGARYLKAVQLNGASNNHRLEAATVVSRVDTGSELPLHELRRFCEILARQGFEGKKVVLGLPPEMVMIEMLELPDRLSQTSVEKIVHMEFARTRREDPNSFEMCYWMLPTQTRSSETSHVLATGCRHKHANAILDLFDSCGLQVKSLDVQPFAQGRVCARIFGDNTQIIGILDIGWCAARLILLHDQSIIYERTFQEAGLKSLQCRLQKRFGITEQMVERLVIDAAQNTSDDPSRRSDVNSIIASHVDIVKRELQVCLSYAAHRYARWTVDGLVLVGGGASISGMADSLSSGLNLPVQVADPSTMIEGWSAIQLQCGISMLTTATGLALYGKDAA